jgi:hypothetical protein
MDRSGSRLARGALLALSLLFSACGPISTTIALRDAEAAIEVARSADAARYAAFELASADAYLRKAREEEGYSDFQTAIDLAQRALVFADKARERALKNPARGGGPGVPPPGKDEPDDAPGEDKNLGSHL